MRVNWQVSEIESGESTKISPNSRSLFAFCKVGDKPAVESFYGYFSAALLPINQTGSTRTPRLRAKDPALFQPGPKRGRVKGPYGPHAAGTSVGPCVETKGGARAEGPIHRLAGLRAIWCRAFSPFSAGKSLPWALPKAGMVPGLWPSIAAFGFKGGEHRTDGACDSHAIFGHWRKTVSPLPYR
jgi:hypothetical protein